jgi:phosphatidylserine decarboxylase
MKGFEVPYFDRRRGALAFETIYARGFLRWLYNTHAGGALGTVLTASPWPSRAFGWLQRRRWSRRRIAGFIARMGIDPTEARRDIGEFESFAEFFTREIDLGRRPVCPARDVAVAPADGRVLAFPTVEPETTFRIKRGLFNLRELLRDDALAEDFGGGAMVISRLSLSDYHHFHFPDSGIPGKAAPIPGRYHAGGPYALRTLVPFMTQNHRVRTLFDSDSFGRMAIVEIGALTVGSIRQCFRPGARVAKGDEKGLFELGGSTVVLLFQRGAIRLDQDLVSMTRMEIETLVRMGEPIGRAPS